MKEKAESIGVSNGIDSAIRTHEELNNDLHVITGIIKEIIEEDNNVINRVTTVLLEDTLEVDALVDTGKHENIVYVDEFIEMDGNLFIKIDGAPIICIKTFEECDDGWCKYYQSVLAVEILGEEELHTFEVRIDPDPLYTVVLGMEAINGRTVLTS